MVFRRLNKLEAIPLDGIGLQRFISHYYCDGSKISSEELRKIAKDWGKWKGWVAFYLIMVEIMNLKI